MPTAAGQVGMRPMQSDASGTLPCSADLVDRGVEVEVFFVEPGVRLPISLGGFCKCKALA
jgi:hypothetical protein